MYGSFVLFCFICSFCFVLFFFSFFCICFRPREVCLTPLFMFAPLLLSEKANSGIQVKPDTITFHNDFCKWSKKTQEQVWYFLTVKTKEIRRKVKPEWNGAKVARTQEASKEEVAKCVEILKPDKPEFVFFHINYLDSDDNDRAVSCILLLFWRASAGAKKVKDNMRLASATSAIRNSMTNISYLEAESKGDLCWENIVAKCKAKK